jgi:tetratricopeptide (TPR) repeat protein
MGLETLATHERVLGADHPQSLAVSHCLGALYVDMERFEDAQGVLQRTLALASSRFGENQPSTLSLMHNLAAAYEGLGRYEEAKGMFVQALDGQRRVLGYLHPDTIESVVALAGVHNRLGEFADAETLLLAAFKELAERSDTERGAARTLALALESMYEAQGKHAEAAEWRNNATALELQSSAVNQERD